jgi:cytochrome c-type biogenesis protein
MPDLSLDTMGLAFGAGLLAAVNPCGFALLPVYLSLFVLDQRSPRRVAAGRALRATAAMAAGFAAVFAVFGLAVAPIAGSVQRYLPGFTIVLGVFVAAAGVWAISGRPLPALRRRRISRPTDGPPFTASLTSMAGFGASYAIASLGCTIAPFLAVVVTAFRAGSTTEGIALFLAYAAGMGLVVGTAAVAVALARDGLLLRMRRAAPVAARAAGALLLVAGAYVAWYGVWELRVLHAGAGADPLVEAASGLQGWLADAIEGLGGWGVLTALLVLLAFAGLRRWTRHHAGGPPAVDEQPAAESQSGTRTSTGVDRPGAAARQPPDPEAGSTAGTDRRTG